MLAWKSQQSHAETEMVGYDFALLTNYMGGWIRHSGWYPDYKLRLYRRDKGRFVGVVHEGVKVDGPIGRLRGHLLHYTIRIVCRARRPSSDGIDQHESAQDMFAKGGRKNWRGQMIFAPPWTIVQRLIFQAGLLDGRRGWLIAWMSAKYIYVKYRKLGRLLAGETLPQRVWPKPGES